MEAVICAKITEAQEKITNITELIYQKKEKEAYALIDKLLVVLMELNDILCFEEEGFKNTLLEAMEALEHKDMVLFADILQYELGEQLQRWL